VLGTLQLIHFKWQLLNSRVEVNTVVEFTSVKPDMFDFADFTKSEVIATQADELCFVFLFFLPLFLLLAHGTLVRKYVWIL
jgi:hypothetical protein